MGNTCRYVVNAVGKGGETYYTHFKNKQELEKWITDYQDELLMNELRIVDKHKHPLLKWFTLKK
jgi:hypothetical protein